MNRTFLAISSTIIFFSILTSAHAGQTGIEVLSWYCTEEGSQAVIRGEVRNQSKTSMNLTIIALFKSIKGVMITYAKGAPVFSPLPGGQTSPIELRSLSRRDIANCELSIQDSSTGDIYSSAKQELPLELPDGLGDSIKGRLIFNGKGVCNGCHGHLGQIDQIPGDNVAEVAKLNPRPSNFKTRKTSNLLPTSNAFGLSNMAFLELAWSL